MSGREMKASWRRLLFFFVCIAIGVASIVTLRSMIKNIDQAVTGEARSLLTADIQIDSDRVWAPETLSAIDRIAGPRIHARSETIESATMVRPADPSLEGSLMIELKGVDPGFPFYGELLLAGDKRYSYALVENNGALVAPSLLDRLNLNVGDAIKIGDSTFAIRGVIDREPGAGGGFRLGPRVYIDRGAVDRAGLTGFGSRARRKILLATDEADIDTLVRRLKAELQNSMVNVRSYKDSQENLSERLSRAEDYLSLTGLVILVLGGIGISNVTRVFIEQKRKSIAVLKCLGATGSKVIAINLVQVLALGFVGSLLGIGIARVALHFISVYLADRLPLNVSYGLQFLAAAQGVGVGVLISLLFSALPLLRIRRIKPNVLLRDNADAAEGRSVDRLRWITAAAVALGLLLLVSWQAGSIQVGSFFLVGLAVTATTLYFAAGLLVAIVRRLKPAGSFAVRQAIASLYRPGNQTRVIVMIVGIGVFLVIAIQSLQSNLIREFDISRGGSLPGMFLIDIQKDQSDGVAELIKRETGEDPTMIPTIRTRIVEIDGRAVDFSQSELRSERRRLGREYVVTYRPGLEYNERIVEGKMWDPTPSSEAEVSLEESMLGLMGLNIGSRVTFDIQGRKITAGVSSFRHVDWRNSRTGFMVLFRPGALDDAPQMMVAPINGPSSEMDRSRFQRVLLDTYPNVSVIDVTDIVRGVLRIVNTVSLAVSFVGAFVLLSGGLILVGSIAMTKFQRVYEAAVLKTLGAKRKTLLAILLAEYGILGFVSGLIGCAAATLLSYATSRWVFEIEWQFLPMLSAVGVLATIALVTMAGALSTMDVLSRKPLAVLRSQ
jgi:putative ABC transport system permease protein